MENLKCSINVDPFSQKAFIGETLFTSEALKLNKLFTITTPNFTFLCNVFVDSFADDKVAEICANIYRPVNFSRPFLSDVNIHSSSFISLQETSKGKALSIGIDLFINEDFYNAFSRKKIHNFCRRSLLGKVVGEGYMCDVRSSEFGVLLGVDGLYIKSLNSSDINAIVNKETEIKINKIISTFMHLEQNSLYNSTNSTSPIISNISSFIKCSFPEIQSFLLWGPANSDKMTIIQTLAKQFNAQLISLQVPLYSNSFSEFKNKFQSLIKSARNLSKSHKCFLVLRGVDCLGSSVHGRVALKYIQEELDLLYGMFNGHRVVVFVTSVDAVECALNLTHEVGGCMGIMEVGDLRFWGIRIRIKIHF